MAQIAAFAHIDVAPRHFERGQEPHVRRRLDRAPDREQGRDFNEAADARGDDDADKKRPRSALEAVMRVEDHLGTTPQAAPVRWVRGRRLSFGSWARTRPRASARS